MRSGMVNLERPGAQTKRTLTGNELTMEQAASLSVEEVVRILETSAASGLAPDVAAQRLALVGANTICRSSSKSGFSLFVDQFKSTVVYVLLAASLVSFGMGEKMQGLAILAAVFINAIVGFLTEYKAKVSLEALEALAGPVARVRRNGQESEIPAAEVVPGDLIILEAGSRVPADVRLIKSGSLSVDESALSGESVPVYKSAVAVDNESGVTTAYQGSLILQGHAKAIVVATGSSTRMGKLGIQLCGIASSKTPLEKALEQMGRQLSFLTIAVCVALLLVGIWHQENVWEMLQVSIALAVAAIPEGLPVVATLALAIGTQRMVRRGALIRKLSAVETLGCTQVICTDKTGTLTQNQMTVSDIVFDRRHLRVSGLGYAPIGDITEDGITIQLDMEPVLENLLKAGALCNDAKLESSEGSADWHVHGDPTEGALIAAAHKTRLRHGELKASFPRIHELPFDLNRKRMTTIHQTGAQKLTAFVKGSPESILSVSAAYLTAHGVKPLTDAEREWFMQENYAMAAGGLRVLGVALRHVEADSEVHSHEIETELVFLGLVAMADQPKSGVKEAIEKCQRAGIKIIVLTGDQPATAKAIARELHICAQDDQSTVLTGDELEKLPPEQLKGFLAEASVLARVKPEMKYEIVRSLQASGLVVAMTGDGVNDAAALRQADIGVSMGQGGTALAREASDMVITDDNFATIVKAIEEGRAIYKNIAASIAYLLTASLASVMTVSAAVVLEVGMPLTALQLLWLNLIMHIFPALGLVLQRSSAGIMEERPRAANAKLLDTHMCIQIGLRATLVTAATVYASLAFASGDPLKCRTIALATLSLALLLQAWSWFILNRNLFASTKQWRLELNLPMCVNTSLGLLLLLGALYLPPLRAVLHTVVLSGVDWLAVAGASLASFLISLALARPRRLSAESLKATSGL
mgnify:CR=1 FL=1